MTREHFDRISADARNERIPRGDKRIAQTPKRRARGFTLPSTIRTVIFLIARKLDLRPINPHAVQPT